MRTQSFRKAPAAVVLGVVCLGIILAQSYSRHKLIDAIDNRCLESIREAGSCFTLFLEEGDPRQYQAGAGELRAFLALYELSSFWQPDSFSALKTACFQLAPPDEMPEDRLRQLVNALSLLERDPNDAAGHTALEIFLDFQGYS